MSASLHATSGPGRGRLVRCIAIGFAALAAVHVLLLAFLGPRPAQAAIPNIILLSLDDAPSPSAWEVAYQQTILASGARNPNGCRIPMTWFSCSQCPAGRKDATCDVVRQARRRGHELATHTLTHPKGAELFTYDQWTAELAGQQDWLVKQCGVPAAEVAGFRAPFFKVNNALGTALRDLNFTWDSSVSGRDPAQRAFRMRAQPAFANQTAPCGVACSRWGTLDLWEVPAYILPGRGKAVGRRVDPAPAEADGWGVLQRLQADFVLKRGSGVPVSVGVHASYLANKDGSTRQPIVDFLSWALQQPDTWALTYQQYVRWVQAPPGTSLAGLLAGVACDGGAQPSPPSKW